MPEVEQVTFSGRRARAAPKVTYVTERCVIRLEADGLTVTEIAPGIDLERDVLGQAALHLRVCPDLREMDPRPVPLEPMGLELRPPAGAGARMSARLSWSTATGTIVTLTLNRPEKLNAMTAPCSMRSARRSPRIERRRGPALILTGAGRRRSAPAPTSRNWTALSPLEWRSWGLRRPYPVRSPRSAAAAGDRRDQRHRLRWRARAGACATLRIASRQRGWPARGTIAASSRLGRHQRLPRLVGARRPSR